MQELYENTIDHINRQEILNNIGDIYTLVLYANGFKSIKIKTYLKFTTIMHIHSEIHFERCDLSSDFTYDDLVHIIKFICNMGLAKKCDVFIPAHKYSIIKPNNKHSSFYISFKSIENGKIFKTYIQNGMVIPTHFHNVKISCQLLLSDTYDYTKIITTLREIYEPTPAPLSFALGRFAPQIEKEVTPIEGSTEGPIEVMLHDLINLLEPPLNFDQTADLSKLINNLDKYGDV